MNGVVWRRDGRIPHAVPLAPADSPWMRLCHSGSDQSMTTVTGFDHRAFRGLLKLFTPHFCAHTPWTGNKDGSTHKKIKESPNKRTGCPRIVSPSSCLGLALAWRHFKGGEFIPQGWFGFPGTHANVWIKFTGCMPLLALRNDEHAKVKMPSPKKAKELMEKAQREAPQSNQRALAVPRMD